ncbi:hypothetical protein PF004_g27221 [Phytophthora fragariae]|uniref:Uncharacterized protein n=1 Tax=Phytophthora fragariae TaxID=53985 RepID=A0A6G0MLF9_9STRA|nr:hypothetical protein PF004_g27221 [Phytophthora fragariae]
MASALADGKLQLPSSKGCLAARPKLVVASAPQLPSCRRRAGSS